MFIQKVWFVSRTTIDFRGVSWAAATPGGAKLAQMVILAAKNWV